MILPHDLGMWAAEQGLSQAILVGWSKDGLTHVVTWGGSLEDAAQAAQGGNVVKQALGFPEQDCVTLPPRIARAIAYYEAAGAPNEP